jgi:hypothetical protein
MKKILIAMIFIAGCGVEDYQPMLPTCESALTNYYDAGCNMDNLSLDAAISKCKKERYSQEWVNCTSTISMKKACNFCDVEQ